MSTDLREMAEAAERKAETRVPTEAQINAAFEAVSMMLGDASASCGMDFEFDVVRICGCGRRYVTGLLEECRRIEEAWEDESCEPVISDAEAAFDSFLDRDDGAVMVFLRTRGERRLSVWDAVLYRDQELDRLPAWEGDEAVELALLRTERLLGRLADRIRRRTEWDIFRSRTYARRVWPRNDVAER